MKTEYHDDLFSTAGTPAPGAVNEIRIEADQSTTEGPPSARELGARLRSAREARGMDVAACSRISHLTARVLQRLENGDFGKGDDYVFVRGALNSYARLLGIREDEIESALQTVAPSIQPALIPTGNALRASWVRRYGAAATYIVLTATVAVPLVWLGLHGGLDDQVTRIAPLDSAPAARTSEQLVAAKPAAPKSPAREEPPLLASMTPFSAMQMDADDTATTAAAQRTVGAPTVAPSPGDHVLTLRINADSWVSVTGTDGKTLESGLLHAGDLRSYRSATPLNVTVGNVDGVQVESDGKPLSLVPYRRANVARFKVFDSGSNG